MRLKLFFQIVHPAEADGVAVSSFNDEIVFLDYIWGEKRRGLKVFEYRYMRYVWEKAEKEFASYIESPFDMKNCELLKFSLVNEVN